MNERTIASDDLQRDHLRHERETRLLQLLTIKAPSSVIDNECRLMLATDHGGHLGAIVWSARVLLRDKWNWYLSSVQFYLHYIARRCGFHWRFRDATDPGVCWVCEALDFQAECADDF